MDSLTQITLGAAVGEVVLGRKVGNRAMAWGAIAGTIPDLDVMANLVSSDVSSLAFHRAFTHSITFAIIAPALLGWLVHKIYENKGTVFDGTLWKTVGWVLAALVGMIFLGTIFMPIPIKEIIVICFTVSGAILLFPIITILWQPIRNRRATPRPNASWRGWYWLFFWAILTHPLLDTCTTFGTQLFQPFSDYRAGLNNISVADPIYTIPFLLCLLIASWFSRTNKYRSIINWIGIGISSTYMLFTFYNKWQVDNVFRKSLAQQNITYERFTASPTIFNNILWQGVAEGDTAYYHGMYSILDKEPIIKEFVVVPKNHDLIAEYADDRTVKILQWFSDDYYNIIIREDGELQFNDMRYGSIKGNIFEEENDYIFAFILKEVDGKIEMQESYGREEQDPNEILKRLITRLKGI